VPEFIDPVFVKQAQNALFVKEYARFGLVLAKTGSINSGTVVEVTVIFLEKHF
jgi:hypothetical protein